ncbi:hypothetical protein MC885_014142 [Smutsia gigantea]|nr:hypothetical protein MC885_014142 [Smutsia gigantea]
MNLASQSGEAGAGQLLFANFNQGNRSLAVGSKSGYKFFSLSSVDKLEQIYECRQLCTLRVRGRVGLRKGPELFLLSC